MRCADFLLRLQFSTYRLDAQKQDKKTSHNGNT